MSTPNETNGNQGLLNSDYWNRKVLNIYWLVVLFSVVFEFINLFLTQREKSEFFLLFILVPTVLQLIVMFAVESLHRKLRRWGDHMLILTAVLLATVLVIVHSTVHELLAVLLLPMLVSLIYYDRSKVVFAFVTSLTAYLAIVYCNPEYYEYTSFIDLASMIGIMTGGFVAAIGIVNRGVEIGVNLQKMLTANIEMQRLAKTDPLTGLYNVREFNESLEKFTSQAQQREGRLALMLVDIDHFKRINDTYGHPVGDEVLREVGKILLQTSRTSDIVCRNGGEEFSILLPDCSLASAAVRGEQLRRMIEEHTFLLPDGKQIVITVSVGVSAYPETAQTAQALYTVADHALYRAKGQGRNLVVASGQ